MVQHPSACEIIFGITVVFLSLVAVNRLCCWLSTRLDEVGGSIMKKDIKESQLLNIIKRRFYSAHVQICCWTSVDAQTRLCYVAGGLCSPLRAQVWFTSAGMNINAGVKLFPVECLTVAGWFTVSVWLWLGMQNKSGHTCSLWSDLDISKTTRYKKGSDFI